jgi:hypothetical protein
MFTNIGNHLMIAVGSMLALVIIVIYGEEVAEYIEGQYAMLCLLSHLFI